MARATRTHATRVATPGALSQPIFHEPSFAEGTATRDPNGFGTSHPSDSATYAQIEALLTRNVVGFDPARGQPGDLYTMAQAYGAHGPAVTKLIRQAGRIIFHAVGDTGASSARNYRRQLSVADQLAADATASPDGMRPAFLFQLGDVVYNFGESQYYYDQFYEPFRNYPAPIFAIPGNHDSFVVPGTPDDARPLLTFQRNFCATQPVITPEAGSLHRTAQTQPGVYFALDAPFVRIIGLFSNALEDPGVISSEGGKWALVPDTQLEFLAAQLARARDEKYAGALLLAVHHPPFVFEQPPGAPGGGGYHGSSIAMLRDIDTVCAKQKLYPHAILSGHAHNYQRFTRAIRFGGRDIAVPFVVCGDGGHAVNPLVQARAGSAAMEPVPGTRVDYIDTKPAVSARGLTLEKYDDRNYGYLRISVDKARLGIEFHQVGVGTLAQSRYDKVTVDLATQTLLAN
jgi:hypothetical protein